MELDFIGWLVVGLLAGILSGLVVPGKTARGCLPNLLVGVLGGIIGGFLSRELSIGDPSGLLGAIVIAFFGAVIVRVIIGAVSSGDKR